MNSPNSQPITTPQTLRGFNDFLPAESLLRDEMVAAVSGAFGLHGFQSISTPAVEYAATLDSKGGGDNEKQTFRFEDAGGRKVALRFDLTVPLARYVAQHQSDLAFPLRASQIGWVWRGERPQKGRYRELLQCDLDVIGTDDLVADAEVLAAVVAALEAMSIGDFVLRVNDRRILNGVIREYGYEPKTVAILRSLDKIEKIGPVGVAAELADSGVDDRTTANLLRIISTTVSGDDETLEDFRSVLPQTSETDLGVRSLRRVLALARQLGVRADRLRVDPSITRGLDYYTGMVYETELLRAPEIGSISSGGRYDNLTSAFTKRVLPGVGGSIGISRLLSVLGPERESAPSSTVIVGRFDATDNATAAAATLVRMLREAGVSAALSLSAARHEQQLKSAVQGGAAVFLSVEATDDVWARDFATLSTTRLNSLADAVAFATDALL